MVLILGGMIAIDLFCLNGLDVSGLALPRLYRRLRGFVICALAVRQSLAIVVLEDLRACWTFAARMLLALAMDTGCIPNQSLVMSSIWR